MTTTYQGRDHDRAVVLGMRIANALACVASVARAKLADRRANHAIDAYLGLPPDRWTK